VGRDKHAASGGLVGTGVALMRAARLGLAAGPWLAAGFAALAVAIGALPVVAAVLTKHIVDALAGGQSVDAAGLVRLVVALAITGVALGVSPQIQRYLVGELGRRLTLRAKGELYAAVNRFHGLARFENPDYLNRIELARQAGENAPLALLRSGLGLAQAAVTASGFVVTLLVLNPVMALLVGAAAVPALLAELALSRRRAELMAVTTPVLRRQIFFAGLLTRLEAVKETRLFGAGGYLRERMLTEQRRTNREQARVERHDVAVQAWLAVLTAVVSGIVMLWAALAALRGAITVGDVMILVAAVAGMQGALATIVDSVASGNEAMLLFRNFMAVVDDKPDLAVPAVVVGAGNTERQPAAGPVPALGSGIVLDDVWFRYSGDQPWVLRGLTLSIPAGQACALVGVNGSGKSTLVKLLCRFYDPQHGTISWDGIDIREFDPSDLRARMGVLFQDFMHYDLTARENVALGDLGNAEKPGAVEAAARLAGVHEMLGQLPNGYDTALTRIFVEDGESPGVLLSGGQWQRVALARALLRRDRDLLVLDEPSSGLDAAAEYEVHTRLREHRRGCTTVLISHRLGAVRDADVIIVLSDGAVIEQGDHDTLMAARGEYFRLFQLQARGYESVQAPERPLEGTSGACCGSYGHSDGGNGGGVVGAVAAAVGHD